MEENVALILNYHNEEVILPHLFYNDNKHHLMLKVTPNHELITVMGMRRWVKKCSSTNEAVREACKRWQAKIASKQYNLLPMPNLDPVSTFKVFQPPTKYTLHPLTKDQNPFSRIVIWNQGARRLFDDMDAVFFMDPISYDNVKQCTIKNPSLVIIAYYSRPNIYVCNGYKNKNDSWHIRYVELQHAIDRVNNEFFRMQPTIECENETEITMHKQLYARSNIHQFETRALSAPYGRELINTL